MNIVDITLPEGVAPGTYQFYAIAVDEDENLFDEKNWEDTNAINWTFLARSKFRVLKGTTTGRFISRICRGRLRLQRYTFRHNNNAMSNKIDLLWNE